MNSISLKGIACRSFIAFVMTILVIPTNMRADEKTPPTRPRKVRTVVDKQGGFQFDIPFSFQTADHLKAADSELAYVYEQRQHPWMKLFIERLGTEIEKTPINPLVFAGANSGATVFTLPWKGEDIQIVELPETHDGKPFVTFNAQIPLRSEAIQVSLAGPLYRPDSRLNFVATLKVFLSTLDGEVGYRESVGSNSSSMEWPHYGKLLLVLAIAIFVGGFAAMYWASRRLPAGSGVLIGLGIFLIGWASSGPNRVALMVSGTLQLLGLAGLVLGSVDYFKRKNVTDKTV